MTTVRKEVEKLPDGNELIFEVIEDKPDSNRVAITLLSKGPQGEFALGRANLGPVFRKQSRFAAESLVDALQSYLVREAEATSTKPLEHQIREKAEAKARGEDPPPGIPIAVKARGPNGAASLGIELDHHTRRDFATTLRQLADAIEVGSDKVVISRLDIQPIRGGGQDVLLHVSRKP